jgi:multiple sugar transport system ATP-binding protein
MAGLSIRNLNKFYANGFHAVKDLNLEIPDKEFTVLVGPSGCGKSTTLRMIAGLEEISSGELYIGDKLVNDVAPKDRDIAMVFQNYALYPHKSVFENIAFGLRLRKVPKQTINERVLAAAQTLGIEDLLKRRPGQLSGGQRQRVALGRAIVRNPQVFLMDEPLSNLDAKLRVSMRAELAKLHQELQTTFIYVTHDQVEAMTMGTRIVIMNEGVVQQVADPLTVYERPANIFVASFIGTPQINLVETTITSNGSGAKVCFGDQEISVSPQIEQKLLKQIGIGGKAVLGLRPEHIQLDPSLFTHPNTVQLPAKVEVTELLGSETNLYLSVNGHKLVAKVPAQTQVRPGEKTMIWLSMEQAHWFQKDTGVAIV